MTENEIINRKNNDAYTLLGNENEKNIFKMLHEFRNWNREWESFKSKNPKSADQFVGMLAKKYKVTPIINNEDTLNYRPEREKGDILNGDHVSISCNAIIGFKDKNETIDQSNIPPMIRFKTGVVIGFKNEDELYLFNSTCHHVLEIHKRYLTSIADNT